MNFDEPKKNKIKIPETLLSKEYNKMYSSNEAAFGGGKPDPIVLEGAKLLPKDAKIIEFGAGQGRNAIALAELGFKVEAIDISDVGIDGINKIAKEKSLSNLEAHVGSATGEMNGEYDMILSTIMLHHLTRDEALGFIEKTKQHTKEGGLNVITTFTLEGDFLKTDREKFFPATEELKELYSGWDIIEYEEKSMGIKDNPDGTKRYNMRADILARKKVT